MPTLPASNRRFSGEPLLFWFLLALHLAPIWILPFIPTQDGPAHQAVAAILRQYHRPEAGLLREYYLLNREALPNWFVFFLMSKGLGFVPVPATEPILLTAYVLLLPLSVRYALKAIDRRATFLAVLSFPFLYNFMFQMGFFNFCFSLPPFFLALGYWLRNQERMNAARTAGLALLVLWIYFCHPVTLVVAVAALLTLAGWRVLLETFTAPGKARALLAGIRRWLLAPLLACLPALALMASFVGARSWTRVTMLPLWVKIKHLGALYSLASVSVWTIPLAIALACLFYALAALCLWRRGRRAPERGDGLLLAVAVLMLAYFTAPSELSGGGFINHRLVLFPFLGLILWFGSFDHSPAVRRWVQTAAAVLSLAFLGLFVWKWRQIDAEIAPIVAAADAVEPDHTLLFLSYAHRGEDSEGGELVFRSNPFIHGGGYLTARKRLAELSLYEANENYFPIYFVPRLNPYKHLGTEKLGIELEPPRVDLLGYPKRTGGRIDYVLLWGLADDRRNEPPVRETLRQLAAAYEPVRVSADGKVQLFKLRSISP